MKMQSKILALALAPLLGLGLAVILIGNNRIGDALTESIKNGLRASAVAVRETLEHADEGEFRVDGGVLYKGEFNVSEASEIADHIKQATDIDITVFYGPTRYMTSIVDAQGNRVVGTQADEAVLDRVQGDGEEYFDTNIVVEGQPFFGYYIPLYESGTQDVTGMIFAGMPQSHAQDQISHIIILMAVATFILFVCSAAFLFAVVYKMVKTLHEGTNALERVSIGKLNIELSQSTLKRKDEIGNISRSIMMVKEELQEIIGSIKEQSQVLNEASEHLTEETKITSEHIEQVDRAVEEIAQGATGQAEETQRATENIIVIGNMIEETAEEIDAMNESAKLIQQLGKTAVDTLHDLQSVNVTTRESIDMIYAQTNTTNVSAQKIKEATALITEIAEETNLLSLNASIEAARAGEQGKGFAVVAAQIQKLAEQSNASAMQIENIINSLLEDSQKAVGTMEEVKTVMGQQNDNVEKTDKQVRQVLKQVEQAIEALGRVAEKTDRLNEAKANVTDTVQNLTAVAQENAASTQESAASVSHVSEVIRSIEEIARQQKDSVEKLHKSMQIFEV